MKTILLASATALALAVSPAVGQTTTNQTTTNQQQGAMTTTQRSMYDSWPAERRTDYDRWPANYRSYFWTLTPDQQRGWWALTDDQRRRVHDMTPEQRTQAWNSITAQLSGAPAGTTGGGTQSGATGNTQSGTTTSGNIQWVRNGMVQNISSDAPPADPPICTPNQQDNCINAWEAGRRGPNVTRPLDHWPGKPASEM